MRSAEERALCCHIRTAGGKVGGAYGKPFTPGAPAGRNECCVCVHSGARPRWMLPLPACGKQSFSLLRTCRAGCSTGWKEGGIRLNCSETRTLVMFCTFNTAIPVRRRSARPAGKLPRSWHGRCRRSADLRFLHRERLLQAETLRGLNRCWGWNSVAEQKSLWRCRRLIMNGIACCIFRKTYRTAEAGQKRSIWPGASKN